MYKRLGWSTLTWRRRASGTGPGQRASLPSTSRTPPSPGRTSRNELPIPPLCILVAVRHKFAGRVPVERTSALGAARRSSARFWELPSGDPLPSRQKMKKRRLLTAPADCQVEVRSQRSQRSSQEINTERPPQGSTQPARDPEEVLERAWPRLVDGRFLRLPVSSLPPHWGELRGIFRQARQPRTVHRTLSKCTSPAHI